MNRTLIVGMGLWCALALNLANAQEGVLAELYGQGVHAYYSHDLTTAHELFTSAIEQGSRDPRLYYYRGLTYSLLGRPDEADADFKLGAEIEVTTTDRVYPIADSLQRVQGRMRIQIERQRQTARVANHTKAAQVQKARYEQLKRSEQNVVRDPANAAAEPARPADAPAEVAPMAEKTDPFAGDAEAKPEKAPEKPAEPAADPSAPAAADPFGAPAAEAPAAEMPAAPADDAKTNPFADDAPAAPAAEAPAAEKPAEKPADDDPFK